MSAPEQITSEEQEYLDKLIAMFQVDRQAAHDAAQKAAASTAAFQSYSEHLHEKYGLDANAGESVNQDGTINRAPKPNRAQRRAKPVKK